MLYVSWHLSWIYTPFPVRVIFFQIAFKSCWKSLSDFPFFNEDDRFFMVWFLFWYEITAAFAYLCIISSSFLSSNRSFPQTCKILCLELPGMADITNIMLCVSTVKYSSSPRFAVGCILLTGFLIIGYGKEKWNSIKKTFKNKAY